MSSLHCSDFRVPTYSLVAQQWLRIFTEDWDTFYSCDDCGGCGTSVVAQFDNVVAGNYWVLVEGFSNDSGNYRLEVDCLSYSYTGDYHDDDYDDYGGYYDDDYDDDYDNDYNNNNDYYNDDYDGDDDFDYVAVNGQGCSHYINMDWGYYGGVYLQGGSTSIQQCAAAVRAYDGQDGCMGDYFFYEYDGYCNCPTDDCSLHRENQNAGGDGQLFMITEPVPECWNDCTGSYSYVTCYGVVTNSSCLSDCSHAYYDNDAIQVCCFGSYDYEREGHFPAGDAPSNYALCTDEAPAQAIISTSVGFAGLACSDYSAVEEAIVVAAVAASIDIVEPEHIGSTECESDATRRALLDTSSATISFDITVRDLVVGPPVCTMHFTHLLIPVFCVRNASRTLFLVSVRSPRAARTA